MCHRKEAHDPTCQGNGFAHRFGRTPCNDGVLARHHRDLARLGGSAGEPVFALRQAAGLSIPAVHRTGYRAPPRGVYGPYTDTCFASTRETDIEHIVATSEAHDSRLYAGERAVRERFASDLAQPETGVHAGEPPPEERRWPSRCATYRGNVGGRSSTNGSAPRRMKSPSCKLMMMAAPFRVNDIHLSRGAAGPLPAQLPGSIVHSSLLLR